MKEHVKVYEMDGSRHCYDCHQTWHQDRFGVWQPEPVCQRALTREEAAELTEDRDTWRAASDACERELTELKESGRRLISAESKRHSAVDGEETFTNAMIDFQMTLELKKIP